MPPEPYYQTPDGKVTLFAGHVLDVLREMPAESVNCVVTSPPYWSLRKYDCEPVVWGGDPNCSHTLSTEPMAGESYVGSKRWQHDGVSRQETPEAWVSAKPRTLPVEGEREATAIEEDGGSARIRHREIEIEAAGSDVSARAEPFGEQEPFEAVHESNTSASDSDTPSLIDPAVAVQDATQEVPNHRLGNAGPGKRQALARGDTKIGEPPNDSNRPQLDTEGGAPRSPVFAPNDGAITERAGDERGQVMVKTGKGEAAAIGNVAVAGDEAEDVGALTSPAGEEARGGLTAKDGEASIATGDSMTTPEHPGSAVGRSPADNTGEIVSTSTIGSGQGSLIHASSICQKCGAVKCQYGLETTPDCGRAAAPDRCGQCYTCHTIDWLREVKRVLRKDGTLWLNIGDGYAGSCGSGGPSTKQESNAGSWHGGSTPTGNGLKPKDAVLMPFRVALAAQADGWWVRSVIIWAKPNPMPESVRDRPTDAHEYIFLLTRSKTYWYDADAIREEATEPRRCGANSHANVDRDPAHGTRKQDAVGSRRYAGFNDRYDFANPPSGRNCRSVWTFSTEPFPDAHFAVFPRELPERCIKAGCPEWVCPKCGKARVRISDYTPAERTPYCPKDAALVAQGRRGSGGRTHGPGWRKAEAASNVDLGWTDCGCGEFVGGVVLDPFAGSGTTCEVAYHLGRTAIGIDASAKYLDMAIERVKQGALL